MGIEDYVGSVVGCVTIGAVLYLFFRPWRNR